MTDSSTPLRALLETAITTAVDRFRAEHPDDLLYGFALSITSSSPQIQAAFATEERLSNYTKRYCLNRDQTLTPELLVIKRTELRWSSLDQGWLINDLTETNLDQALAQVANHEEIEAVCIEVLRALDQKGLFGQGESRYQVTIGVTQDQDPHRFLQRAKQLNPEPVIQQLPS